MANNYNVLDFGSRPLLHIQDQKTAGTTGGNPSSGSWFVRDLNTILTNEINGASLAANIITLPRGIYECRIDTNTYAGVNSFMARLWDNTAGAVILWGTSERCQPSAPGISFVTGRFTLTQTSNLWVEMQVSSASTVDGLGYPVGTDFTVDHETYSDFKVWKVG